MPELHLEVLPKPQRALWEKLKKEAPSLSARGYYLAGGSGLALQVGHRQSVDFDFFSQKKGLGPAAQEWLSQFTRLTVRDLDPNTLHAEADGVKVSFLSAYKYPTVEALVDAQGIPLAGITDIALMKLLALTHRATLRDYLDLAALLRDRLELKRLMEASKKKYGKDFNAMIFLRALTTFSDIDPEMPVLLDQDLKKSWQKILREAVKKTAA